MHASNVAWEQSDAAMEAKGFQFLSNQSDRFQLALKCLDSEHRQEVVLLQQEIIKLHEQLIGPRSTEHNDKTPPAANVGTALDKTKIEFLNESPLVFKTTNTSTAMGSAASVSSLVDHPLSHLSVPHRENAFTRIVHDVRFELTAAVLIFLYSLVMAVRLQYDGLQRGHEYGFKHYDDPASISWPHGDAVTHFFYFLFNVLFCVEFALRVAGYRCLSWCSVWMWIDGSLVTIFILQQANILGEVNLSILRLFRLVRLLAVVKMIGMASMFHSLFHLIKSLSASIGTLVWSFFILLTFQTVIGMCLMQSVFFYVDNSTLSDEDLDLFFEYFGTFTRTTLTMFQLTYGNWSIIARELIPHLGNKVVGEALAYVIAIYHCVLCFAMVRVIQAVFITETSNALKHDEDLQNMKRQDEQEHAKRKFLQIFHALDENSDGYLEWDEFQNIVNEQTILNKFKTQEIDPYDLQRLFVYLDDGDGRIDIDEFINGTLKATGEARCLDLLHVLGDLRKLAKKFDAFVLMSSYCKLPVAAPLDRPTNSQRALPERFVPNEHVPIMEIGPPCNVPPRKLGGHVSSILVHESC